VGNATHLWDMRNTYCSFVKGRDHWKTDYRWDGNIKIALKEGSLGVWTVLSLLKTGIGEQNNEPSECLKGEEFHEWVSSF